MEQVSRKLINFDVYRVEDYSYPTTIPKRKPHRTIVKGLKLLNQIVKAVAPKTSFTNFSILTQENNLPLDLFTYEILARLPIKCLLRLKSVSKEWCSTVSSYEFANIHFKTRLSGHLPSSPVDYLFIQVATKFYLLSVQDDNVVLDYCLVKLEPNFDNRGENENENEVQLIGSCNGLVCLANSSFSADYFYIWNPVSYDWRKFSDPCFTSCNCIVSWGFVHVSSIDDYKVVKIVQDRDLLETTVHVFSLHSREWRRVHDHGLDPSLSFSKTNPGVLVDDSLYWIMVSRDPLEKKVVIRFNLTLEKFEEVPGLVVPSGRDQFLCVIGGCLSTYNLNIRHEADLSILKQPGEVKPVTISSMSDKWVCSGLVGPTKTGKFFVISKGSELALMDEGFSAKDRAPLVTLEQADRLSIVSYVPSLISPFSI
ncbi:F-box/kelch-repeat protein At3g23880-like [Silene latifolia]|uniref:F-box/kelch-repeat protein At3g23880-like n=1 Tax=Silene latifolia TaxID=37657 RepID=UPI003D77E33A